MQSLYREVKQTTVHIIATFLNQSVSKIVEIERCRIGDRVLVVAGSLAPSQGQLTVSDTASGSASVLNDSLPLSSAQNAPPNIR